MYTLEQKRRKKMKMDQEHELLQNIINISGVWKYIRNNRRNNTPAELPEDNEMTQHFMELLEGKKVNESIATI